MEEIQIPYLFYILSLVAAVCSGVIFGRSVEKSKRRTSDQDRIKETIEEIKTSLKNLH